MMTCTIRFPFNAFALRDLSKARRIKYLQHFLPCLSVEIPRRLGWFAWIFRAYTFFTKRAYPHDRRCHVRSLEPNPFPVPFALCLRFHLTFLILKGVIRECDGCQFQPAVIVIRSMPALDLGLLRMDYGQGDERKSSMLLIVSWRSLRQSIDLDSLIRTIPMFTAMKSVRKC